MTEIAFGWQVAVGISLFFVLLVVGLEVMWCFVFSGAATFLLLGLDVASMPRVVYHAIDTEVLMAVAYFLLAGALMSEGGIAEKLISWVNDLVGWIRGGLPAVAIMSSLFFGALTGSGLTSVAALTPILVPRMEDYGYRKEYSTGVICASAFMGHLIPPSIPFLVYGLLADQSIAALFASTIIPGCLLAGAYVIINAVAVKHWMIPAKITGDVTKFSNIFTRTTAQHTWAAIPALLFPIIIIGGIYLGAFTPTEAAAVSCIYALVIGLFVYKGLKVGNLPRLIFEAAGSTGMIIILVGTGMFFSRVMLKVGVAEALTSGVLSISSNPVVILIMINLLLLFLGMFMETLCILIIVVPLLLPLFDQIGMNLVHAGAMVVLNCGIGMVTPPFAATLFLGARVSNVQLHRLIKPALLFIALGAIPVLLLTTYIPQLSLWLPTLLVGEKIVGLP
ncbi:MAG: TRAP transporter large permease [Dehalococcoidia bacterium]|nr:TRAP transporter large permease [Dehalococcoidia bacterium]